VRASRARLLPALPLAAPSSRHRRQRSRRWHRLFAGATPRCRWRTAPLAACSLPWGTRRLSRVVVRSSNVALRLARGSRVAMSLMCASGFSGAQSGGKVPLAAGARRCSLVERGCQAATRERRLLLATSALSSRANQHKEPQNPESDELR